MKIAMNAIHKLRSKLPIQLPVEFTRDEADIIRHVIKMNYTMTSPRRIIATAKACKYAVANDIPGDFVECGVWRGGNAIVARRMFDLMGSEKLVWMFDTFEGMTVPTQLDVASYSGKSASDFYKKSLKEGKTNWCLASIEDVRENFLASSLSLDSVRFIKGDVCETLKDPKNLPSDVAVLRLDTDWYESTKFEMETLYPILSSKGVLLIDDYGHWEGSRKAVDEFFATQDHVPLLNYTDKTGRSAIKP